MPRIPIAGPSITDREIRYVTDAVTRCWYEQANDYVERFERGMEEVLGVPHAIALPSCTSAIHLALLALEIGPGDEVIVPDVTWIATAAPLQYVGATPVFVDIDPRNWCLSVAAVERALTPHTKGVLAVDLYGQMPDWPDLRALCDRHRIPVIEDAAEGIGSRMHGVPAGAWGDIGVFSFHGSKTMTTGEGGMLVTRRRAIAERVQVLRDHGRAPGDCSFLNREVAYKYKMSSLQAALGLAQLERLSELVRRKQEIFAWYEQELRGDPRIALNPACPGVENSYWMTTAVIAAERNVRKETLIAELAQRGIDSRPFFYPLSSLPAYGQLPEAWAARTRNRVAYQISPFGINLPSALALTRRQVVTVAATLRQLLDDAETARVREEAA